MNGARYRYDAPGPRVVCRCGYVHPLVDGAAPADDPIATLVAETARLRARLAELESGLCAPLLTKAGGCP